ncbi:MAG: cyclohexanecarboxylate-CoA ligase [Acidimicrobiia bacterium]
MVSRTPATTFAARLSEHARRTPHKLAVVAGDERLTYSALDARVARVATRLAREGARADGVVSSQLPNGVDALVLALAVNRLGAVHNPIGLIAGPREVDFILDQAASAVFVDSPGHAVLVAGGDGGRDDDRAGVAPPVPAAPPDVPRFLVYTSGSTADPKGVLHSDATLTAECAAQAAYHRIGPDEVFVMPSPIAHVSGLIYGILLPVWLGATSVLLARWDPTEFLAAIERERGTFSGGATPFLQGLVDHPDVDRYDLSSFRVFPCGGADVPPDLIRRARERLGLRTGRGYGSTELPSTTSAAGPDEPDDKRALTDGRPIGDNQVRIAADGEIEATGPERFLGYLDATLDHDALTADGWLRTGDLGTIDPEGYLTVTGRAKDVVVRLGEKIPAREVETLVAQHPAVADVAVIALPDERTGERACACIVVRPDATGTAAPSLDDLTVFLTERGLARRRLPEQIEVVTDLPRSPNGKVDKRALRQRYDRAR